LGVEVDAAGRSELGPGGLELPLARLLAEMHKGRVWVESNATTGTTFYVQLPAYQETVT
jgi:signal transduction histidine kinase